jgi:hypothetical protein
MKAIKKYVFVIAQDFLIIESVNKSLKMIFI